VIHCLGLVYGYDRTEEELLAACYRNALRLAAENSVTSVAFPPFPPALSVIRSNRLRTWRFPLSVMRCPALKRCGISGSFCSADRIWQSMKKS